MIGLAPFHSMNTERQRAILTLALLAVFADAANDERECEQIRHWPNPSAASWEQLI